MTNKGGTYGILLLCKHIRDKRLGISFVIVLSRLVHTVSKISLGTGKERLGCWRRHLYDRQLKAGGVVVAH